MATRRGWGDDAVYFDHTGPCTDTSRHRRCAGRWRGVVSLGYGPDGKRIRRKVSGQTKAIVHGRLTTLHAELETGFKATPQNYTLRRAAEDWLAGGLTGRAPKTIKKNENVLAPILAAIGARRLRELTADDVHMALDAMAKTYSSAAVAMGHNALTRAIRHAEARNYVGRNVATLVDTPHGQAGRPSKSLTREQAAALLRATTGTRIGAYIALCISTGIRTEEARALRWGNVDLDASPPYVEVWRSVRAHHDVKTNKSRRTLALPAMAAAELRALRDRNQGAGPVFATRSGGELDAANIRREFLVACKGAAVGIGWTPRELRHSFVSLMSDSGVPVEEIARLAGHVNSRTTETVYRHQLKPIMTTGAEAMDRLLGRTA